MAGHAHRILNNDDFRAAVSKLDRDHLNASTIAKRAEGMAHYYGREAGHENAVYLRAVADAARALSAALLNARGAHE
jgi:hypothetical protein